MRNLSFSLWSYSEQMFLQILHTVVFAVYFFEINSNLVYVISLHAKREKYSLP